MSIPRKHLLEYGRRPEIHPEHPGLHLAELLVDFNLSQYALAKAIGVPRRRINEIVLGQRAISADTALRLGRFFGMSAEYWHGIQADFDLRLAYAAAFDELAAIEPFQAPEQLAAAGK